MDAQRIMTLLTEACHALEEAGEHAAAAYVGHAMGLVEQRFPEARGRDTRGERQ